MPRPDRARAEPAALRRAAPVPDGDLTEVGRLCLRLLPPPGEPFPPERRRAYLATVGAIIEDMWGGRDED